MIYPYKGKTPQIAASAFIADYVTITGDVVIGEETSIWFNTVIRGDVAPTVIGNRVNIQDNSILHQSPNNPLIIEDGVTVGHQVILHSAIVRKNALIGMGSIILDRAEIGEGAFIGAGSLVPPGKKTSAQHARPRPAGESRPRTDGRRHPRNGAHPPRICRERAVLQSAAATADIVRQQKTSCRDQAALFTFITCPPTPALVLSTRRLCRCAPTAGRCPYAQNGRKQPSVCKSGGEGRAF
ncbi:transferase [Geobacillus sp. CAMR12739]|nr:transferase [Geobacillus sp. CAMR12739]